MHILDLALQGVRRFVDSSKFPFKPGFNLIQGPAQSGKTTLVDCLLDLLYPNRQQDGAAFVSQSASASRAGLTIGAGQEVFRVLKDYRTGKISLTQFNRASQKFEPIAADPAAVAQNLVQAFELPDYEVYLSLFLASAATMPSILAANPAAATRVQATTQAITGGAAVFAGHPGAAPGPGYGPPGMPHQMAPGMAPAGYPVPSPFGAPPGMMPGMPPGMMPGMMPGMPGMPGMMPGMTPGMMPGMPGMTPFGMPMGTMPPGMVPGMTSGVMPGMMPGMVSPEHDDGLSFDEREAKLVQLKDELKIAKIIDHLQYEIDGIQQKVFEIESKKKSASQFDSFLKEAKEQLEAYPSFHRLPEKIDERCDKYHDLHKAQGAEVEKVNDKARKIDEELAIINSFPPIFKQMIFMIGAGALVVGILFFLIGRSAESMAFLKTVGPLAAIGGVVAIAVSGFQQISRLGQKSDAQERLAKLDEQRQQIVKRFEVETAVIERLMTESDSDNAEELKTKIAKWKDLDERARAFINRKKKLIEELQLEKLEREEAAQKAKIKEMETELRQYPALSSGLIEMKKEIERLTKLVAAVNPNSPALAIKVDAAEADAHGVPNLDAAADRTQLGAPPPGAIASPSDPLAISSPAAILEPGLVRFDAALEAGIKLLETDRAKLIKHLGPRYNLYLNAISAKRYAEGRLEIDGSLALKDGAGKWIDFDRLAPGDKDVAFIALQITLLELVLQKRIIPVLLDNPFAALDPTAATIAAKALKRLAERTQIVLLSVQPPPAELFDHTINLT